MVFGFRVLLSFKSQLNENWAYLQAPKAVLWCSLFCGLLNLLGTRTVIIYKTARPCIFPIVVGLESCRWNFLSPLRCLNAEITRINFKKKFFKDQITCRKSKSLLSDKNASISAWWQCALLEPCSGLCPPSVSAAPRSVRLHFKQCGNKTVETQSGYLKYLILC